jgi:uncharacterized protein
VFVALLTDELTDQGTIAGQDPFRMIEGQLSRERQTHHRDAVLKAIRKIEGELCSAPSSANGRRGWTVYCDRIFRRDPSMQELTRLGPGAALLAATLLLSSVPAAEGQGSYPAAQDPYVNDFAGRLASGDVERIRSLLSAARQATGVQATAVVIDSIRDYGTNDRSIESFATHLFNAWGVGDAARDDGVLFLVALGDREVRIELGAGYGDRQSPAMQRVVDQRMLPRFKAGDFGGGIYDGAAAALAELAGWRPQAERAPAATSSPQASGLGSKPAETTRRAESPAAGISGLAVGVLALLAGVGTAVVRGVWRRRRRKCPHCGLAMIKLDDIEDDIYLTRGRKEKEAARSVDYDVWRCESCDFTRVKSRRRWFPPDFADADVPSLPQVTRPGSHSSAGSGSSSFSGGSSAGGGSSSFGGGSSAGGGASGKW